MLMWTGWRIPVQTPERDDANVFETVARVDRHNREDESPTRSPSCLRIFRNAPPEPH